MSGSTARSVFARSLLEEVAPVEIEFFEAYDATASDVFSRRHAGTGMGLPPEVSGVLGMVAVIVGRTVFDKLGEWAFSVGGEIVKKFLVDSGVERLKKWLKAPEKSGLAGVLTTEGYREVLAVVERDARAAKLKPEEIDKLLKSVAARLDS